MNVEATTRKPSRDVILSVAKNLGSICRSAAELKLEMFRFVQHDNASHEMSSRYAS